MTHLYVVAGGLPECRGVDWCAPALRDTRVPTGLANAGEQIDVFRPDLAAPRPQYGTVLFRENVSENPAWRSAAAVLEASAGTLHFGMIYELARLLAGHHDDALLEPRALSADSAHVLRAIPPYVCGLLGQSGPNPAPSSFAYLADVPNGSRPRVVLALRELLVRPSRIAVDASAAFMIHSATR